MKKRKCLQRNFESLKFKKFDWLAKSQGKSMECESKETNKWKKERRWDQQNQV